MSLQRALLRQAMVSALLAAGTAAGSNVFASRIWPSVPAGTPAVLVQVDRERKLPINCADIDFRTTPRLTILMQVVGQPSDQDTAETVLETLCAEAETAILEDLNVSLLVERWPLIETQMVFDTSSGSLVAQARLHFYAEFTQTFAVSAGTPLAEIDATVALSESSDPLSFKAVHPAS